MLVFQIKQGQELKLKENFDFYIKPFCKKENISYRAIFHYSNSNAKLTFLLIEHLKEHCFCLLCHTSSSIIIMPILYDRPLQCKYY